ncbi:MAG: alkaline phosphatase [Nevskiaceae bacterium]|nr:MAG: alkaline phosphatase [Nevskiaceae bacterium]TBR71649.1 MAG: alkaline phosphatase [Nevskiaceae bacterium]
MIKHFCRGAAFTAAILFATAAQAAGEARNVIFFLGDGMGPVPKTATRIYKVGEAGSLAMDTLPYTARVRTHSLNAQTTDSAPSMSAYMTGVKMNNEVVSMSAATRAFDAAGKLFINGEDSTCAADNGTPVTTLLELAKEKSKATGVVTTTRVTHATPAATYSHICHRDGENDIAAQLVPGGAGYNAKLGAGVDVVLGGGSRNFVPSTATGSKRTDARDLIAEMKTQGYTYITNEAELTAVPNTTTKLLGLFNKSHMNYELDRSQTNEPSLAEMTTKAIDILAKNPNGYFLMVEGGRIDHALHGTNAKRALQDTVAFDDAIQSALDKVDLSNTVIVVTADHDHTMVFNGYGKRGSDILGLTMDYVTGAPSTDVDGKPYTTLVFGNGAVRHDTRPQLTQAEVTAADYLQEAAIVRGTPGSETHGSGDVQLFAIGAGAKSFKGTMDNTKVFGLLKTAAGY